RVHAQNLMEAENEQDRRASLEHLIAGVDRTSRLVNQLLTMARLEPRAGTPPPEPIDLVATVRDSLIQMTPWLLSKDLELVLDVTDDIASVRVDPTAIDIALNNLVTNAANFSPAHGLVTVGLKKIEHGYELTVEDDGPGIREEERDRLFERFYSRGNDQGAGLGLTIVQTIAARFGGQIKLENRTPSGLRATLKIGDS
ncbi:two-component sensor histidine kinase, partial [Pseudomonas sp. REP124]|uniref:sensor histidine kinase n=1 Tax=Pseudomonas sp. REP124 TaxID=2875731 RepID=UPI0021E257B1